jgi:RNA polymerase sigma-70 factor (ECF subfamily)
MSEAPSADSRQAIEELMTRHGGTIYGLGLRICGSSQAAEDMVQETFLDAYRGWRGFEGRSEATTWLYTIARRACTRMHRTRAGEPREMETLEELLPGRDDEVADLSRVDPFDESVRREARERVDRALAELPEDFRMALVLVDLAELSIAEVARVLGIPENTVKTRVHRARLKLRKVVEEGLPRRAVPAAGRSADRNTCMAMLQAKQESLDRGVELPIPGETICERCRSVFAVLDLSKEACGAVRAGGMPEEVRRHVEAALAAGAAAGEA